MNDYLSTLLYCLSVVRSEAMTAAGAVIKFFRAEQPIKLGLFIIVPRENDAFGDHSLVCRSK